MLFPINLKSPERLQGLPTPQPWHATKSWPATQKKMATCLQIPTCAMTPKTEHVHSYTVTSSLPHNSTDLVDAFPQQFHRQPVKLTHVFARNKRIVSKSPISLDLNVKLMGHTAGEFARDHGFHTFFVALRSVPSTCLGKMARIHSSK